MKIPTEPKIEQKSAFRIAGLRYEGKNEHGEIPAMWDMFIPRIGELESIQSGGVYGIARSIPGMDASEGYEYLAGVEVRAGEPLPQGMVAWEIPAHTYAVLPAQDIPGIGPVNDHYEREWLPNSKDWEPGGDFMMEYYPPSFGSQDMILYLYFPVTRKKK